MSQILRETAKVLFLLGLTLLAFPSFSQDNNVDDVQKSANELFEQGKYLEAKDLYSQLVSLYPKDENFNYRFGACLLFVDVDKTYPLKFLEYAVSKPNVDVEAFYFLGKGYHYNYRFDEAISYLNKYKEKRDAKDTKYPVDNDIRYCENGKSLMINITNPLVITKKKVSAADFFTSFKLSDMGGRMLYAPKELHSSIDKKKGYVPIMYKNANSSIIYYSSYGNTEKYGLDIYKVSVSDNGMLGKPVRLSEKINTQYDERFPFLTEDKSTFYFSSTGHNSMGGADIFQASFDTITNTFGQPRNLDYSVNTPDDDFMYAEVGKEGVAYFASNRNCEKGKAYVYKINAQRKAFQIAVLAGSFDSKDTKSCKITVEDLDDHVVVGSFNTNKKSGDYVMRLKNGGRYSFLVEPFGGQVAYQGRVELPNQSEIKLLKQEIQIVEENGTERLIIRNLFEEVAKPEDQKIIAQVFVESADIVEEKAPEITINSEEVINEILVAKQNQEKQLELLQTQKNASFFVANQKRELAHKDLDLAEQLEKQLSINDSSVANESAQKEYAELVKDAKIHLNESKAAYDLGVKCEQEISNTQTSIKKTEGYLVRIEEAKENESGSEVIELYSEFNNEVAQNGSENITVELDQSIKDAKLAMKRAVRKSEQIENEQESLKQQISSQKAALKATKKKKEKAEINSIITGLEADLLPLEQEKINHLAEASSHEVSVTNLENEKRILGEISETNQTTSEINNDQKIAMLASITATDDEIIALESTIRQSSTEAFEPKESNSEVSVLEEATAGIQNSTADATEEVKENEEAEIKADISEDEPVLDTIPVTNTEIEIIAEVVENSGPEITEEKSPLFESSVEYESPVEDMVVVEGQSIPLNITSNTGKRQYTREELKSAKIVMDKAQYNAVYQEEFKETKSEEDKRVKAHETQRINYNWVVAIEKEVAELKYAKEQSTSSSYKSNIDSKIEELNAQATQKRNFMALNARIIKQLDQENLAAVESVNENSSLADTSAEVNSTDLNSELASNAVGENNLNEGTSNPENAGIESVTPTIETENFEATSEISIIDTTQVLAENAFENAEAESANTEPLNTEKLAIEEQSEEENSTETGLEVIPVNQENSEILEVAEVFETEGEEPDNETLQKEASQEQNELVATEVESETGIVTELATNELGEEIDKEQEVREESLSPIEKATISPSGVVVAEIAIEKSNEVKTLTKTKNDISSKRDELADTRKKKQKRVLEAEIVNLESEEKYSSKKLELLEVKSSNIEMAQSAMVVDPLSVRPSEGKYLEARKLNSKTADLQVELDELEVALVNTKKKKKRRVIEAEIINVKRELSLAKLESQMASESVKEMKEVEEATLKGLTPYGKEIMVPLPVLTTELNPEQFELIQSKDSYKDYLEVKEESEKQIVSASVLYQSAKAKQVEVARMEDEISLLNEGMDLLPRNEQDSLKNLIIEKRQEQKRLIVQADVEYQEAKMVENTAFFNLNEANSELLVLDDVQDRNMIFMALSGSVSTPVVAFDSSNIDAIPTDLTTDIFIDSDSTFYDESKPIPVDVALPQGVILKVQIGAFRNPINQSTFKGFAPIVGEKTESGLTRYTAGLFKDFETANSAKNGIRAKGYSDAFVVAYLNGKRISISEARRVLAGELKMEEVIVSNNNTESTPNNAIETAIPVTQVASKPLLPGEGDVEVVETQNRGELFFTVQVGVYNDKIQPGSVFSITPLNSEKIANNLVRYSSGVYGSIAQASQARNTIVKMGISDAFVTAYYKGARISITEARGLVNSNGGSTTTGEGNKSEASVTEPVETVEVNENPDVSATYHVSVGPYQGGIPIEQAREILKLNSFGVVVEKNNNATLYKIGSFTNRQEAEAIKVDLESKGFSNPSVVKNE